MTKDMSEDTTKGMLTDECGGELWIIRKVLYYYRFYFEGWNESFRRGKSEERESFTFEVRRSPNPGLCTSIGTEQKKRVSNVG